MNDEYKGKSVQFIMHGTVRYFHSYCAATLIGEIPKALSRKKSMEKN
jgi:hypothetical protein